MAVNTFLWVVQGILALKWLSVAYTHGVRASKIAAQSGRQRLGAAARLMLAVAGVGALLGAVGLVLPAVVAGLGWLAPWSAAFLAVLMLLGVALHLNCRATPKLWAGLVLIALGALVAVGRWVIAPL